MNQNPLKPVETFVSLTPARVPVKPKPVRTVSHKEAAVAFLKLVAIVVVVWLAVKFFF